MLQSNVNEFVLGFIPAINLRVAWKIMVRRRYDCIFNSAIPLARTTNESGHVHD